MADFKTFVAETVISHLKDREIADYILVIEPYAIPFTARVKIYINRGYVPLGGVAINAGQSYVQALIKYK
jgi:hypothetical protein